MKNLLLEHKSFFVICKSVSVLTGPTCFLLQLKLIWLAALSSNYWLYDFNDTRFQFFKIFLDIFVLLVTFELLSHYSNIIHIIQIFL